MNSVILRGVVGSAAVWSHMSHQEQFYRLWVDVPRLSGKCDRLRVFIPEDNGCAPGTPVEINGQMRTYNNKSGVGSRLIVSALARSITVCDMPPDNRVYVSGALCRAPGYRKTPLGREICDIMLAVPRTYNRSDYLPLIAWGGAARVCAEMETGAPLYVEGRFQSRDYTKIIDGGTADMTAYEISVVRLFHSEEELSESAFRSG